MLLIGANKMKVKEIFYSIQGEGLLQGLPTIFIRSSGCNLRCKYCDTAYSYEGGKEMTPGQIIKEIKRIKCNRICITGGEPLLQDDLPELISKLKGYELSMETNGSLDVSKYKSRAMISLDIKCPCSGFADKMYWKNLLVINKKDQVKFIVKDNKDINYAFKVIKKYKLAKKTNVIISPVWGADIKHIALLILKSNLDIRLGIQLHKIIWGKNKKGV